MPSLPDVPQVLRCQLNWTDTADKVVYNTFYLSYTGSAPSDADASNIAVLLCNAWATDLNFWDTQTSLTGAKVTDLSSATAAQGTATCDFTGTELGEILAGGTALVANFQIARRYRGGKPRLYLPWGTTGVLTNRQEWTPAWVASVAANVALIFSTILGTTVGGTTLSDHVNVSYYKGFTVDDPGGGRRARNVPTLRPTPVVDNITGRTILGRPGSQRRRNSP
jgi:hypothetical protein